MPSLKPFDVFSREEMNEILLIVYKILDWAISSDSNIMSLDTEKFTLFRDTTEVGDFRINRVKPTLRFRDALEMIIDRDQVVGAMVHQISATKQEIILRIASR